MVVGAAGAVDAQDGSALSGSGGTPGPSSPGDPTASQTPILTIDAERLYEGSLFGDRIETEIAAAEEALAAQNRRIEEALTAEERTLTQRRPAMDPAAFRAAAAAFDEKVQSIREEQDAKERAIGQIRGDAQRAFLQAATPVLGAIMRSRGATVILERRSVFGSIDAIDVTELAIVEVNREVGDGTSLPGADDGREPRIVDPIPPADAAEPPEPADN